MRTLAVPVINLSLATCHQFAAHRLDRCRTPVQSQPGFGPMMGDRKTDSQPQGGRRRRSGGHRIERNEKRRVHGSAAGARAAARGRACAIDCEHCPRGVDRRRGDSRLDRDCAGRSGCNAGHLCGWLIQLLSQFSLRCVARQTNPRAKCAARLVMAALRAARLIAASAPYSFRPRDGPRARPTPAGSRSGSYSRQIRDGRSPEHGEWKRRDRPQRGR
jgi:hypothetical protein